MTTIIEKEESSKKGKKNEEKEGKNKK